MFCEHGVSWDEVYFPSGKFRRVEAKALFEWWKKTKLEALTPKRVFIGFSTRLK